MKKLFFIFFLMLMPLVIAHAGEEPVQESDGKQVELTLFPEEPHAGSMSILSFEVEDTDGESVTHIDGFLDISKDGEILVKDYELHSHGNQFSMSYKFQEAGQYTATLTVQPSDHYENEKFDSIAVIFYITVEKADITATKYLYALGIAIAVMLFAILIFSFKKKKSL